MTVRIDSSRSLPFLDNFSPRDRKAFESSLARSDEERRKSFAARDAAASKLTLDFRARAQSLLGTKKYAALRDEMTREQLAFRSLWQPPVKPGRDDSKENAARRRRIDTVLRKLGSDAAALRALGQKFDQQTRALATGTRRVAVPGYSMSGHLDHWAKLSPLNILALPWGAFTEDDPNDPHRWFAFFPPFFGFNFQFASSTLGYVADREHVVDPAAGLIGYRATLNSNNDSEYEIGSLGVFSAIAFGFEAPTAGLVEILVDAQCALAHHHVKMEDQWGWSESTTLQQNSISMDVLHPNTPSGTEALMSDFRADGNDGTVDRDYLVAGEHYFAQAVSSGAIAGGTSVVVQIGTFGADDSKRNDVSVKSESHFRWFVSSVQVRIRP